MREARIPWHVYRGNRELARLGWIPGVAALAGVRVLDTRGFSSFRGDLTNPHLYPDRRPTYTFIEPNYGDVTTTYRHGNSQHPLDSASGGEQLIKETYEAIRGSRLWESSLLIVTWDEHGGFYDHVPPPPAVTPQDSDLTSAQNRKRFRFDCYGPRVPAVVVSPYIAKGTLDGRIHDHASIPAAVERAFGLQPMTRRDRDALPLDALLTLARPRTSSADARLTLPDPAPIGAEESMVQEASPADLLPGAHGNLAMFLYVARKAEAELAPRAKSLDMAVATDVGSTRRDAEAYMDEIGRRVSEQAQRT